jgi:hypothetical protein
MEIRKSNAKPLEFKYEDVTFFVKPAATEEDRMVVSLSGKSEGDKVVFSRGEYCKAIIQCMVTGWKGVTADGKEIEYEYDLLADFPKVEGHNVYLELGGFILKNTDIKKGKGEDLKKD